MKKFRPLGTLEEYFLTCSGGVRVSLVVLELGQSVPFELQNVQQTQYNSTEERGRNKRVKSQIDYSTSIM